MKVYIIHLRFGLCNRLNNSLIGIYSRGKMLRYIKIDRFVSRTGNILTFFHDRVSQMGNTLISRMGKTPTDLGKWTKITVNVFIHYTSSMLLYIPNSRNCSHVSTYNKAYVWKFLRFILTLLKLVHALEYISNHMQTKHWNMYIYI